MNANLQKSVGLLAELARVSRYGGDGRPDIQGITQKAAVCPLVLKSKPNGRKAGRMSGDARMYQINKELAMNREIFSKTISLKASDLVDSSSGGWLRKQIHEIDERTPNVIENTGAVRE